MWSVDGNLDMVIGTRGGRYQPQLLSHFILKILVNVKYANIIMVDSKNNYFSGFNAVRKLITTLIPLIPLTPLIWIPGVDKMGNKIYRFIANNRKKFCCRSC